MALLVSSNKRLRGSKNDEEDIGEEVGKNGREDSDEHGEKDEGDFDDSHPGLSGLGILVET